MAFEPSEPLAPGSGGRDIRALRPYVLTRRQTRAFARRVLGIVVLATLDALGLALGLYAALVIRNVVYGDTIFWNLLWREGPVEWLPFLLPITWLVFWHAGLYARRERRAGLGRVASSMVLVAAITLAFAYGTDYDFTTSGLVPTACVTCVLLIGAFRAAYDSFTVELQRLLPPARGCCSSVRARAWPRCSGCWPRREERLPTSSSARSCRAGAISSPAGSSATARTR